jgi:predicted dehydrogenase
MVRFGILGFGLHAVKRLLPGFRQAENACVTAISRRDRERAWASAREYGIPQAFDSPAELCRSPEVDAVFIATPNVCHLPNVLLALESGKPVLCEKPMGLDALQCQAMVEAARKAGLPLGVAQVFRFADSTARIRVRLLAGQIGNPIFARSEFSYPSFQHPRTWIKNRRVAGGGPIADVGVHCIDVLRFVLQDEVACVHACGFQDQESGEVEAAAVLSLQFRKSTLATVLVSTRTEYRTPLEFVGETGTLRVDDALSVERAVRLEVRRRGAALQTEEIINHLAYARQVDAFAAAVEGKAKFPVPGEEGWRNQLVLDAAYRSLQTGKSEPTPDL